MDNNTSEQENKTDQDILKTIVRSASFSYKK